MNRYLPYTEVASCIENNKSSFIDDPDEEPVTDLFSPIENEWPIKFYKSKHLILRHLGDKSLKILELASGTDPLGLYMASLGHEVTVSDTDSYSLDWQERAAKKMQFDSMTVEELDVLAMDKNKSYDVVIANMLLHFFDEADAQIAINNVARATRLGGLASVSAYTTDNPVSELMPPRSLKKLYDGPAEVERLFDQEHWTPVDFTNGMLSKPMNRSEYGKGLTLLPSVTEVIMRKSNEARPKWAIHLPDFTDIDDVHSYAID